MLGSILILLVLPLLNCLAIRENYMKASRFSELSIIFFCLFITNFYLLADLGAKHPEGINNILGIHATIFYFIYFLVLLPISHSPSIMYNIIKFFFIFIFIFPACFALLINFYYIVDFVFSARDLLENSIESSTEDARNLFHYLVCSGKNPLYIALKESAILIYGVPGLP